MNISFHDPILGDEGIFLIDYKDGLLRWAKISEEEYNNNDFKQFREMLKLKLEQLYKKGR